MSLVEENIASIRQQSRQNFHFKNHCISKNIGVLSFIQNYTFLITFSKVQSFILFVQFYKCDICGTCKCDIGKNFLLLFFHFNCFDIFLIYFTNYTLFLSFSINVYFSNIIFLILYLYLFFEFYFSQYIICKIGTNKSFFLFHILFYICSYFQIELNLLSRF